MNEGDNMSISDAEKILEKYDLAKEASKIFEDRTRKDTGRKNIPLRLDICAALLTRKLVELRSHREQIIKNNPQKCPFYLEELKNNPFAHDDCSFINMACPKNFCYSCDFYLQQVVHIDNAMEELSHAIKCYKDAANQDRTWI